MPIRIRIWIGIDTEIRLMIGMKTLPIYNTVGADTDTDLCWWSHKTFLRYCLLKGVDP